MLQHADIAQSLRPFAQSDIRLGKPAGAAPCSVLSGMPMTYPRGAEIYGEGETFGHIYQVVSGVVRIAKLLPDGRRQISCFYLPGDIFGFEAGETRHFSAEAVVQTKVVAFRWQSLIATGARSIGFFHELLNVAMKDLRHTQAQLLVVGRKSALERVAAFLLEMSERSASPDFVELPMPRHDIADYLGLTLETVSRMFAELKDLGAIALEGARRVRLLDRDRLAGASTN
jgi:CRP/FNR family transcriptional regulator, nitrogen fixation regulation protein